MVEGAPGPVRQKQQNIQKEGENGQADSGEGTGDGGAGLRCQDVCWMDEEQCMARRRRPRGSLGLLPLSSPLGSDGSLRHSSSCDLT